MRQNRGRDQIEHQHHLKEPGIKTKEKNNKAKMTQNNEKELGTTTTTNERKEDLCPEEPESAGSTRVPQTNKAWNTIEIHLRDVAEKDMKTGDKYLDYKERNQEEKTINTSRTPITPTINELTRPSIAEKNALRIGGITQWTITHKI